MDTETMEVLALARDELARKDTLIAKMTAIIERQSPMAEIGEAIVGANQHYTVAEAAKEMAIDLGDGKRMGQNQLYAFMRNTRLVIKRRDPTTKWEYHQPYQSMVDAGHMKLEDRPTRLQTETGKRAIQRRTLISGKGVAYLKAKIIRAQQEGILDELVSE